MHALLLGSHLGVELLGQEVYISFASRFPKLLHHKDAFESEWGCRLAEIPESQE